MDLRDVYWLAGLLEGEGCFACYRYNGDTPYPTIKLAMCDEDVVRRAFAIMKPTAKLRYVLKPAPKSVKPQWIMNVYGRRAIAWMMVLYPLLGVRRREKIRECIKTWKSVKAYRCVA